VDRPASYGCPGSGHDEKDGQRLSKPLCVGGQCLTTDGGLVCCWSPRSECVRQSALQVTRQPGPRPEVEPDNSGCETRPDQQQCEGKSAEIPPESRHHPGQSSRDVRGGAPVRPSTQHRRQWVRSSSGPQPSWEVRGSRSRDGVAAPPGAVYLLSTLLGDLHTNSRRPHSATPGRRVSPKRPPTPNPAGSRTAAAFPGNTAAKQGTERRVGRRLRRSLTAVPQQMLCRQFSNANWIQETRDCDGCGKTIRGHPRSAGNTRLRPSWTWSSPDHPRVRGEHKKLMLRPRLAGGSPPRARGTRACAGPVPAMGGITPACAGNTPGRQPGTGPCRDHPRVRGEHPRIVPGGAWTPGSPPRARGTHRDEPRTPGIPRITPACAGNTRTSAPRAARLSDHPRVRGEHTNEKRVAVLHFGITPACAGNTSGLVSNSLYATDHPRVRGEHVQDTPNSAAFTGSPPRARGTPQGPGSGPQPTADHPRVRGEHMTPEEMRHALIGSPPRARGTRIRPASTATGVRITPACAGNTAHDAPHFNARRDHPRVRGEHLSLFLDAGDPGGSPPRARGTPRTNSMWIPPSRITPACAGNTEGPLRRHVMTQDHPRVRGEHAHSAPALWSARGSPPRARGTHGSRRTALTRIRITPACAGNTPMPGTASTASADHPRVRGEHLAGGAQEASGEGSPPRARGTPGGSSRAAGPGTDHPRVRGEHAVSAGAPGATLGSPPRARGTQRPQVEGAGGRRITPACAGNTGRLGERPRQRPDHPRVRGEHSRALRRTRMS